MKPYKIWKALIIFGVIFLSACGGGGSGDSGASPPQSQNPPPEPEPEPEPEPAAYIITTSTSPGGEISPVSLTVASGDTGTFTIQPDAGYIVDQAIGCEGQLTDLQYITAELSANCGISVSFKPENINNDQMAPTAEILFPWHKSKSALRLVQVRGTAEDDSEVSSVNINGVAATLELQNSPDSSESRKYLYHWNARITIDENSETPITVSTSDIFGNSNSAAAEAAVIHDFSGTVSKFRYNPTDDTLVVISSNYGISNADLSIHNLSTGEKSSSALPYDFPLTHFELTADGGQLLGSSFRQRYNSETGSWYIDSFDISSLDLSNKSMEIVQQHEPWWPADDWQWARLNDMALSPDGQHLYAAIELENESNTETKSQLVRFDLNNNTYDIILDGTGPGGEIFHADEMEYTNSGIAYLHKYCCSGNDGYFLYPFDGSTIRPLIQSGEQPPSLMRNLTSHPDRGEVYLLGYRSFLKINVETGYSERFWTLPDASDFPFDQMGDADINPVDNTILIANGLNQVLGFDIDTGDMHLVFSKDFGEGVKLLAPRAITYDRHKNLLYAADDGGNAREKIIEVDLNTGNRRELFDINDQFNIYLSDIVLNDEANELYLLKRGNIIRIRLDSGEQTLLAGEGSGSGTAFSGAGEAALDKSNNRLITNNNGNPLSLVSIDLSTGHRELISKPGVKGDGDAILSMVDVSVDPENNRAFVLSQAQGAVFEINLSTGDRKLLLTDCIDVYGTDQLIEDSGHVQNMYFDSDNNELLITGERLLSYSLTSNTCKPSDRAWAGGPLDILKTAKGQIIGSKFHAIVQYDFDSAQEVIISE